jgi:uncharacterized membrane protein (DUF485 family)
MNKAASMDQGGHQAQITFRKLNAGNLQALIPLVVLIGIPFYVGFDSFITFFPASMTILLGAAIVGGIVLLVVQFNTRIVIDHTGIYEVRAGKKRMLPWDGIQTFFVCLEGRYGNRILREEETNIIAVGREKVIFVSLKPMARPKPVLSFGSDASMKFTFRQDAYNFIKTKVHYSYVKAPTQSPKGY